jgi:hypothetical protein
MSPPRACGLLAFLPNRQADQPLHPADVAKYIDTPDLSRAAHHVRLIALQGIGFGFVNFFVEVVIKVIIEVVFFVSILIVGVHVAVLIFGVALFFGVKVVFEVVSGIVDPDVRRVHYKGSSHGILRGKN